MNLGDRMKQYEQAEAGRRLIPMLPVFARMDGRNFHSFTKNMDRPFDTNLHNCMVETTKELMTETNAMIGYTQSDEITLAWYYSDYKTDMFFGGNIHKLVSTLAALTTIKFACECLAFMKPQLVDGLESMPTFDTRVWNVPHLDEAANVFLWRELDATRNSIFSAARSYYSHKEIHKKNSKELQELIWQKGMNWNDYPDSFKRGTYIKKQEPTSPELRTKMVPIELPPLMKITNRPDVLFYGAEPILSSE